MERGYLILSITEDNSILNGWLDVRSGGETILHFPGVEMHRLRDAAEV